MRTLDPRLVARTRAARPLLVADAAMGIATTVPVIVQATVLAGVVTRAFGGDPSARLGAAAAALVAAFAVRGALAWGFEVAGRRAAASVLSELRLDLVGPRLRTQPRRSTACERGEVAPRRSRASRRSRRTSRATSRRSSSRRSSPSSVLVVRRDGRPDVGAHHAADAAARAGVHGAHRPLHRAAHARAWQALRRLSTHFLDVVRGLPTLRAFNRAASAAGDASPRSATRYRRTTMATLRVAFLSGAVLELAATLGVALVAVTVGVRLVDGDIALQAGPDGARARPRALPAAPPARRAVPRQRRRAGGRRADARAARGAGGERRPRGRRAAEPGGGRVRLEARRLPLPGAARARARPARPRAAPGRDVALVGESGRRQEHGRLAAARAARRRRRADHGRRRRPRGVRLPRLAARWSRGCRSGPTLVPRHGRREHPPRRARRRRTRRSGRPRSRPARRVRRRRCPPATTTTSATAAGRCRPASAPDRASRARSSATRRS